jgi:hypothetical protein
LQQRRATEVRAEQSTEQKGDIDKRAGRSTYRPSSYSELVEDAVEAVAAAMKDGHNRLEVEFPAVSNVDGGRRRRLLPPPHGCRLLAAAPRPAP